MNQTVIRPIAPNEIEAVRRLLVETGWAHRVGDSARFSELVRRSTIALVAVADQEPVGFVRALSDGLSNGYVSMLTVAPGWRQRGIGRALVKAVLASGDEDMTWVLRAGREHAPVFFARFGFTPSQEAMERKRQV